MTTDPNRTGPSRIGWVLGALAIVVAVMVAATFLRSGDPDGLNRVATDHGFIDADRGHPFSIIAGYVFPGLHEPMATIVAGLIGIAVVFGIAWVIGRLLARRRRSEG
ncbi:MAG: PDGLE domain-containing protein [Chloroflexi bacterium]|nr:PDGLE domain-containing protein [Chloroflexota bacterium]